MRAMQFKTTHPHLRTHGEICRCCSLCGQSGVPRCTILCEHINKSQLSDTYIIAIVMCARHLDLLHGDEKCDVEMVDSNECISKKIHTFGRLGCGREELP